MKDETKLASVAEFVGLKSKMCSYIKKIEKIEISENVVKNMARQEYKNELFKKNPMRHDMKRIQSKFYQLGTYKVKKTALSCFDNKQYILDNGIKTYGYKDINQLLSLIHKVMTIFQSDQFRYFDCFIKL